MLTGQIRFRATTRMPAKPRWTSFILPWITISNSHMISSHTKINLIATTVMLSQVKIRYSTTPISNLCSLLTTMTPEWLKRIKVKRLCTCPSMTFITWSWRVCARTRTNKLTRWCWPSSLRNSAVSSNSPQFPSSLWVRVWNLAAASFKFDLVLK